MTRKWIWGWTLAFFAVILAGSLLISKRSGHSQETSAQVGEKKVISLIGTSGEKMGTAELTQLQKGVEIHVEATGLVPGKHALHLHELASCDAPDFKSAGGHFNPTDKAHGFDNPKGPHDGDLSNIFAGTDGSASADILAKNVTLREGKSNSLLKSGGTSLIIHASVDDYKSDPSGNAGGRVACGTINP